MSCVKNLADTGVVDVGVWVVLIVWAVDTFDVRYFKRRWAEGRGDEHDSWSHSDWFFETADDGTVLRQVEAYDCGPTLRYGPEKQADQYGMLADQPLDLDDFDGSEISEGEFITAWDAGH